MDDTVDGPLPSALLTADSGSSVGVAGATTLASTVGAELSGCGLLTSGVAVGGSSNGAIGGTVAVASTVLVRELVIATTLNVVEVLAEAALAALKTVVSSQAPGKRAVTSTFVEREVVPFISLAS